MKIVLVYNKKAGGELSLTELRKKCKEHGITIEHAIAIDDSLGRHLKAFINDSKVIAAVGGDGTIGAVASLVAGTKAMLAPLPGGTLNHFTKDLGIPQEIDEALRRLTKAKHTQVDVASVNDKVFINNSSIGLYPSSLQERNRFEDRLGKWPAALIASIGALLRMRTHTLEVNGKVTRTPFVFVGNNIYDIDALGFAQRKVLDAGLLTVLVAHTTSRLTLLKIVGATIIGKSSQLHEFDVLKLDKLTIKAKRPRIHVSYDGEVTRMQTPLHYEVRPKALRLLL